MRDVTYFERTFDFQLLREPAGLACQHDAVRGHLGAAEAERDVGVDAVAGKAGCDLVVEEGLALDRRHGA